MVDIDPADVAHAPVDEGSDRADDAVEETGVEPSDNTDKPNLAAGLAIAGFGAFLAIAYFPLLFDKFARYDDEGFYLTSIRQFLDHGSLYSHTRSAYGPFYYSFMGVLFRATGQTPTLFNGRLLVLVLTAAAGCIFGATVFRVSRNLLLSMLAQFASFLVLMRVAGNEPMHPASLIILLVAIVAYALAAFAMTERATFLVIAGAATGAIAMCKINVGIFAAAAIVMGLVIGNRQFAKVLRGIVAVAIVGLPFALMLPRVYQTQYVQFATLVALALLATLAPLHVDRVSFSSRILLNATLAAIGAVIASAIWPLLHGTSPGEFVKGVITAPLKQVDHLAMPPSVNLAWIPIALTLFGALYALSYRRGDDEDDGEAGDEPTLFGNASLPHLLLAAAAVWVFGLGIGFNGFGSFGAWMPAIALLCALAWTSAAPPKVRIALRLLVPLAILQSLHAYPVAGSQKAWATVAVFTPCAIALAAALDRLPTWTRAGNAARTLAIVALGLAFTLSMGLWPISIWRDYEKAVPMGLPGTRLVRVSKGQSRDLKDLTRAVKRDCDTFYSAPGFDSLYVFTGITPPTGLLSNHAGVLNTSEQKEVASELAAQQAAGKRVCIVRDGIQIKTWLASSYGTGPLGAALAPYAKVVAKAGFYTVSVKRPGAS